MLKSREIASGADKRFLLNNSRRNSNNVDSIITKVTPQDFKNHKENLSFMNPLNNISDIEHALSDSRLDAHLQ